MNADERDPNVRVVDRRWWAQNGGDSATTEAKARKPTYVEDLEQQLADARNRVQELLTGHRQSVDEFDQVRSRMRRDVARDIERGKRAVLVDFLDVADNLDRAIGSAREQAAQTGTAQNPLVRGIELVREQFLAKLETYGVTRLRALGQPFDAERHEAVTESIVTDPSQDGIVIAVIREGYIVGEELLRPAAVVVGRFDEA